MKFHTIRQAWCAFVALLLLTASNAGAQEGEQEYAALEGVTSVKAA